MSDTFSELDERQQFRFLSRLSFELTIDARAVGTEREGEQLITALKGFSELQHQLSAHLGHLIDGDEKRYPNEVFWSVLREKASAYKIAPQFQRALKATEHRFTR